MDYKRGNADVAIAYLNMMGKFAYDKKSMDSCLHHVKRYIEIYEDSEEEADKNRLEKCKNMLEHYTERRKELP